MMAMWYTEAMDLIQGLCRGSSEMSDTKPFIANKGWLWTFRIQFEPKNTKMTGKAVSANTEAAAIFYLAGAVYLSS